MNRKAPLVITSAVVLLLGGCDNAEPRTPVSKEYESAGYHWHTRKTSKRDCSARTKSGSRSCKTVTRTRRVLIWDAACWEIEYSDGSERCVSEKTWRRTRVPQGRS